MKSGSYFRRGIAVFVMYLTYKLTVWSTTFAEHALADKGDLMATAAIIGAVAGVPIALLTLLLNKYVENQDTSYKDPVSGQGS